MDIKELSVGDWVYVDYKAAYIKEISETVIVCHIEEYDNIDNVYTTIFEPIPLTAEKLEKNGFIEIEEDIYKCCVGEVYIEIGIFKPMFIYIGARVITSDEVYDTDISSITKANGGDFFVHDLQHALRLCGIDKKIKL